METFQLRPRYIDEKEKIDSSLLINQDLLTRSKKLAGQDFALTFWFCRKAGEQTVGGGIFGEQSIQTKALPKGLIRSVRKSLDEVDALTGLTIKTSKSKKRADVHVYYDESVDLGTGSEYLGLTTYNEGVSMEIFLNHKAIESTNQLVYTTLHEIGHTLGLEHPHDDADSDHYLSTSILESASPRQTVMSYQQPTWDIYPEMYQFNDLKSLQKAWGKSCQNCNFLKETTSTPIKPTFKDKQINTLPDNGIIRGKAAPNSIIQVIVGNQIIGNTNANKKGKWRFIVGDEVVDLIGFGRGHAFKLEQLDPSGNLTSSDRYYIDVLPDGFF